MAMTREQAEEIATKLVARGSVRFFNAAYGRWGFEHRGDDRFHYHSEHWATDVLNPQVKERDLSRAQLVELLERDFLYDQLIAKLA